MQFDLTDDFLAKLAKLEALDPELAELLRSKLALMRQAVEATSTQSEMAAAMERLGMEIVEHNGETGVVWLLHALAVLNRNLAAIPPRCRQSRG